MLKTKYKFEAMEFVVELLFDHYLSDVLFNLLTGGADIDKWLSELHPNLSVQNYKGNHDNNFCIYGDNSKNCFPMYDQLQFRGLKFRFRWLILLCLGAKRVRPDEVLRSNETLVSLFQCCYTMCP